VVIERKRDVGKGCVGEITTKIIWKWESDDGLEDRPPHSLFYCPLIIIIVMADRIAAMVRQGDP
jgi:hypothetical protein